jgi:hypothetical protein
LEIATSGVSVLKLLKGSKWKNVNFIATIKQSKYRNDKYKEVSKNENETIEVFLTEVNKEGQLVKRMSAEKFYILNYQMTRISYRITKSKPNNQNMIEEMKENELIKVVTTSETEKPTPQGESIRECGICLDNLSDIMLPCLHAFCNQCIVLWQAK